MANIQYFPDFNIFDVDPKNFKDAVAVTGGLPNTIDVIFEPNFDSISIQGVGFDLDTKMEGMAEVVTGVNGGNITFISAAIGEGTILSVSGLFIPLVDIEKLIKKGDFFGILDVIFGGDDTITTLGFGDEGIHGGPGMDTADYDGERADYTITETDDFVTVTDNNAEDGDDGTDTLRGVEYLQFDDQMVMVTNADSGGLGGKSKSKTKKSKKSDIEPISGTEGDDDPLNGTDGDDIIEGLGGNDTLNGFAGKDQLIGGAGNDRLDGGTDKDTLIGGAGTDVYFVTKGDKVIETEDGGLNDIIRGEMDLKVGKYIEDATLEGTGDYKIKGNNESNSLVGNDGDNKIDGKGGFDLISGGGGVDDIKGGKSDDEFFFEAVDANDIDRIRDFEVGEDLINLTNIGVTSFDQFLENAAQDGKNTVYTHDNGAQLILSKTDLDDLSASDFVFAIA